MTKLEPYVQGATIKLSKNYVVTKQLSLGTIVKPKNSLLHEYVYNQIYKQNSNLIVLVEGLPGKGKSVSIIAVGERWSYSIRKSFTIRYNVVHTISELMSRVADLEMRFQKGESVRGTTLVFDDAGVSMDAREWQNSMHKVLNDSLEVMRYLGLVLFITVPSRARVDKKMRDLAHATMRILKKREGEFTLCKFYLNEKHWKTGDDIPVLLRAQHQGWTFKIDLVKIRPPSVKLFHDYQKWMMAFKGGIIRKNYAKLQRKSSKVKESERKSLTERQRQVYLLLKYGSSTSAIAQQLQLGEAGVSTHIRNIRAKGWIN